MEFVHDDDVRVERLAASRANARTTGCHPPAPRRRRRRRRRALRAARPPAPRLQQAVDGRACTGWLMRRPAVAISAIFCAAAGGRAHQHLAPHRAPQPHGDVRREGLAGARPAGEYADGLAQRQVQKRFLRGRQQPPALLAAAACSHRRTRARPAHARPREPSRDVPRHRGFRVGERRRRDDARPPKRRAVDESSDAVSTTGSGAVSPKCIDQILRHGDVPAAQKHVRRRLERAWPKGPELPRAHQPATPSASFANGA